MLFILLHVGSIFLQGVDSQLGVTTCSFATQNNCAQFLPNSYCDLNDLVCKCSTVAGYIDDGTGTACTYECGALAAPANGGVDTSGGTTTGDVATFSCNNGYKVSGSSTSTCVADTGWYNTATTCAPGELGDDCSSNIFLCTNIAFGTCNFVSCVCQNGYEDDGTGRACTEIDECAPGPCQNGATCTDAVASYSCACVAGYTGTNCDIDIDECVGNPCQNGATCIDCVNSYTCNCVAGYDGTDCENNVDECAANLCQNGATCNDAVNDYSCLCAAGYNGTFCADDIDECVGNPCQNGATCVDGVNSYTCNCVAGYDGNDCENTDELRTSSSSYVLNVAFDGVLIFFALATIGLLVQLSVKQRQLYSKKGQVEPNTPGKKQMEYVNCTFERTHEPENRPEAIDEPNQDYIVLDETTKNVAAIYDTADGAK